MVKYYKEVTISGIPNEETLEDIITSTETFKYKVNKIIFTETTSTPNNDAQLRVYLEREKILDINVVHLLTNITNNSRTTNPWIELDLEIPIGQTLSVGFVSASTASNFKIAIEYEIVE